MIAVLSPAKNMQENKEVPDWNYSVPENLKTSEKLIKKLKNKSEKEIANLMSISANLAELNKERYENWSANFDLNNSRPAGLMFAGDVYRGLKAEDFQKEEMEFANEHVFILSGLHGILRMKDLIRPYRLEMGTKLGLDKNKNLYEVWSQEVSNRLLKIMKEQNSNVLINLASKEYFKVIDTKKIGAEIIAPTFKEFKNGQYKFIQTYGKTARGTFARYMVKNKVQSKEDLLGFNLDGYEYNEELSTEKEPVFTRG